jgi:hypothetical protein
LTLKPFFCYYGGKWRMAGKYPAPLHRRVVEPFAGAAGYSVRHHERDVVLYDVDPRVFGVWDYLIRASPADVLALPVGVQHVDEVNACQEAKWLVGWWFNKGNPNPCNHPGKWMRDGWRPNSFWGEAIRARIARQVGLIKHWKVHNLPYTAAPLDEATWHVDPPYHASGYVYKHSRVDYEALGEWCRSLPGQVMVCEQAGATWLPFSPFLDAKTTEGKKSKRRSLEVVWPAVRT